MTQDDLSGGTRPRGVKLPYLQAWRIGKLMNSSELAHKIGKSPHTISYIEHGGGASFQTVRDIAAALGITPDDLVSVNPSEKRKGK